MVTTGNVGCKVVYDMLMSLFIIDWPSVCKQGPIASRRRVGGLHHYDLMVNNQ